MALGRCPVCSKSQHSAATLPKVATKRNEVRDKEETMDEEIIKCPLCGLWHPLPGPGAGSCNAHCVMFGRGYAAGCAAQSKEDRRIIRACSWCKYKEYETCRDALAAGRSHQAKLDMIAICNRADEIGGEYGDVLRDQAIAALAAAAIVEEK